MKLSRRDTLQLAAALGVTMVMPFSARAQAGGDSYRTAGGEIVIHPINHASFVMTVPGLVIYNDPVGGKALYEGHEPPGLILISHEHGDHFDPETLAAIAGPETRLVVNPAVLEMLPEELKSRATSIANGETTTLGEVEIEAIPAYNTTEERKQYHPQGRDNGYVLTVDGSRVYIAGDTEDIPEMRALTAIDIAFVPMNLPYTMDVEQAGSAVAEFKPKVVYPYHFQGSDLAAFAARVAEGASEVKVVQGNWYAA